MKNKPHLRLDILTLFPGMFEGPLTESLLGKARERGRIEVRVHNLRDFSTDAHRKVDDRPYGGGAGMVIQAEPLYRALAAIRCKGPRGKKPHVVFLSPQGTPLTSALARRLSGKRWIVLVCGHYEGIDERFMAWVDQEISIGDYVLMGGELPAMVVAEAVARWVPGVVKEAESLARDSFENGLLDYPHYTRPALWRGKAVPEVLLSGNHEKIQAWRRHAALKATKRKRPDLATKLHH